MKAKEHDEKVRGKAVVTKGERSWQKGVKRGEKKVLKRYKKGANNNNNKIKRQSRGRRQAVRKIIWPYTGPPEPN